MGKLPGHARSAYSGTIDISTGCTSTLPHGTLSTCRSDTPLFWGVDTCGCIHCIQFQHTCYHICLYQTTTILFIRSSTIVINGTILSYLLRVNNFCVNQPSPYLNHLVMFTRNHRAYFNLGNLVRRGRKLMRNKKYSSTET